MTDTTSANNPMRFTLDGTTNRTEAAWREIISCHAVPAHTVPARRDDRGRLIPAHYVSTYTVVQRQSWRASARQHAAEHGAAGVWRADDSFVLFYRDRERVRQRGISIRIRKLQEI